MTLFEQLVAKAKAAESGKFLDVWALHCFLDEHDHMLVFISVGNKLEELSPNLTDKEMAEARQLGCSFPDDWDHPKQLFGPVDE